MKSNKKNIIANASTKNHAERTVLRKRLLFAKMFTEDHTLSTCSLALKTLFTLIKCIYQLDKI